MIKTIKLINFQDMVECNDSLHQSKESFLAVNYEFKKGNVYGLISDFGCGSWGLSNCVGGRGTSEHTGKILLNNDEISVNKLSEYSCFITEKIFQDVNSESNLMTPKECIAKALSISKQPYTIEQIKKWFCLSDGRFERPIEYIGTEIWTISIAVNFALGKEIYCYPWLNMIDISRFMIAYEEKIIDLLKSKGKIVIVPSSQKRVLRKYCDHTIFFEKGKMIYR